VVHRCHLDREQSKLFRRKRSARQCSSFHDRIPACILCRHK
jgi:hypothetical protein